MTFVRQTTVLGTALLASTSALSLSASAQAPNWTFGYTGAHAGYDWSSFDVQGVGTIDADGFAGGLLGGVNFYQSGNFVVGIEADITWMNGSGSVSDSSPVPPSASCSFSAGTQTTNVSAEVNWKASLRGRAGVLVNPTVLVYATAGVAWADVSVSGRQTTTISFCPSVTTSASDDQTFVGGVAGGGVETLLAPNIYGRVEALHYFFNDEGLNVGGTPIDFDLDETIARTALVLRLN